MNTIYVPTQEELYSFKAKSYSLRSSMEYVFLACGKSFYVDLSLIQTLIVVYPSEQYVTAPSIPMTWAWVLTLIGFSLKYSQPGSWSFVWKLPVDKPASLFFYRCFQCDYNKSHLHDATLALRYTSPTRCISLTPSFLIVVLGEKLIAIFLTANSRSLPATTKIMWTWEAKFDVISLQWYMRNTRY